MFNGLPAIDKQKVLDRLLDMERASNELARFKEMDYKRFIDNKDNFPIASYWLRLGIEAALTIGTHILSRLPQNGKKKDYTQIILSLGDYGVLSKEFANRIKGMAGYRNRLVHLYWEVEDEELYKILKENLEDFKEFDNYIRKYLKKV